MLPYRLLSGSIIFHPPSWVSRLSAESEFKRVDRSSVRTGLPFASGLPDYSTGKQTSVTYSFTFFVWAGLT